MGAARQSIISVAIVLSLAVTGVVAKCPCSDESLCKPLTIGKRTELFAFATNPNNWKNYNYNRVTTIALFGFTNPELLCFAHQRKIRVVLSATLNGSLLNSSQYRDEWVEQQIQRVKDNYVDGLNLDYESPLASDSQERNFFTEAIGQLSAKMKMEIPGSQLSIDVGWGPGCIDGRCYDVLAISQYVDLMLIMAYDESSQILGPCIALPNSPPLKTFQGLLEYINYGIPRDKLIVIFPWYGYDYTCVKLNANGECEIAYDEWRGIQCSDAVGRQLGYFNVYPDMVAKSLTGRVWNNTLKTAMFNYKDANGTYHQVWCDDPESLKIKYYYAAKYKLAGLSVWDFDCVSYDEKYKTYTDEMYSAMDVYFNNLEP
jgi:di-N-acetylchitobiase